MTIHAVDENAPQAPAGRAAQHFAELLGPDLTEFPITGLDHVGMPVWSVWWQDGAASSGGIGYGATEAQARVGALGETLEAVASMRALSSPRRPPAEHGSYRELVATHGAGSVADPRTLGLPAGIPYDDDRPLDWLTTTRWRDGSPVLVPVEFVASSPSALPPDAAPLIVPVTNGQGAGSSLAGAVRHGVLEILQRDGNGVAFRALDRGTVVDLDEVRDPATRAALDRLRGAGVEVLVKLAATDFGLPNVYVVGAADGDDVLQASACGEAVDPDREVALRKALLEFASARARKRFMHGDLDAVKAVAPPGYLDLVLPQIDPAKEERRVLEAMLRWRLMPEREWRPMLERGVLARRDGVPFSALPTSTSDPVELLHRDGFDVLVADFSPVESDGAHAVKVLVPGLEVETVAYGRIGERNVRRLLDDGRTDLVRVGDAPSGSSGSSAPSGSSGPGWARVQLTAAAEERLGGPAWLDREGLTAVIGDLLPLYREPFRHAVPQALG